MPSTNSRDPQRSAVFAISLDISSTLCDLASVDAPKELEGTSFARLLDDPTRDPAKLVAEELYDEQSDPDENENIAGKDEFAKTLTTLREQMDAGWRGARPREDIAIAESATSSRVRRLSSIASIPGWRLTEYRTAGWHSTPLPLWDEIERSLDATGSFDHAFVYQTEIRIALSPERNRGCHIETPRSPLSA